MNISFNYIETEEINISQTTNKFICETCGKIFSSRKTLRRHLKREVCSRKEIRNLLKFRRNLRICPRCSEVLSTEQSLQRHLSRRKKCVIRSKQDAFNEAIRGWQYEESLRKKQFLIKMEKLRSAMESVPNEEESSTSDVPASNALQDLMNLSEPLPDWEPPSPEQLEKEELIKMVKEQADMIINLRTWIQETQHLLNTLINTDTLLSSAIRMNNDSNHDESHESDSDETVERKKEKKKRKRKKKEKEEEKTPPPPTNIEELIQQGQEEIKKRLSHEKQEWNSILRNDEKQCRSRVLTLRGYWKTDKYILSPVRHYADCYPRGLLLRNLRSAKLLSSIINPYFYPSYRSTYATRVYIDAENNTKAWLRDESDTWHHIPFKDAVKNMVFHSVSAFIDLIRREKPILSENDWCTWRQEQATLENSNTENYQFVLKNLEKRIPSLRGHPEEEENRIAKIFLQNEERKIATLEAIEKEYPHYCTLKQEEQDLILWKRVIYDLRVEEKFKKARQYHEQVPNLNEIDIPDESESLHNIAVENAIQISEERYGNQYE